jgi:uncharacterized protein YjbJ (UPF0337 family)
MSWDHIEGRWQQFKKIIRQQWHKLTDEQLDVIAGRRDLLADKIERSYGISKEEAEKEINAWQEKQKETSYLMERAAERNGTPRESITKK